MVRYFSIRVLAAFLFMGSVAAGFLAYAEYGKWVGWVTFAVLAISGVILHIVASKLRQKDKPGGRLSGKP